MKKNFVFVSTAPFFGGALVICHLANLLRKRGYDAKIFLVDYIPVPDRKFRLVKFYIKWMLLAIKNIFVSRKSDYYPIDFKIKKTPFISKNTIVVYPDIIFGNPLRATKVVRWFLFYNRFVNDSEAYGRGDLFFAYREIFNDYDLNPTCRLLHICYFNSDLYRQTNFGPREGVCYIVRKGKKRPDLPKFFDGPVIDNLPEKEKVAVLNQCKCCCDYDTQTFYTSIACVCGCVPIVMMEPGKTKSDYLGKGDVDYGRAYGNTPEQIEYAIRTRPDRLKMLDFSESNKKNIDFFIQEVEKYFGE